MFAHSKEELQITYCPKNTQCETKNICPFLHTNDHHVNIDQYYERMYHYVRPYESVKVTLCKYLHKGCIFQNCRKAHNEEELQFNVCLCQNSTCYFYHPERDTSITKQQYYQRMLDRMQIFDENNNKYICRYYDIGCRRVNCTYAHSVQELQVHKCLFKTCRSETCMFIHRNDCLTKEQYFLRMLQHSHPLPPKSIVCDRLAKCNQQKCLYAHSVDEIVITNCIRGNKCKKNNCPFQHPFLQLSKQQYFLKIIKEKLPI
jgi:hypothetical protein